MADQDEESQQPENILIAHVTAHLLDGTHFELYPFVDATNVKAKVAELVGGWASSGFLLRGAFMIPWHQVRMLEASKVEEITIHEARQRRLQWEAEDEKRAMRFFWRTREDQKEDGEGDDEQEEKGSKDESKS